MKEYWLWWWGIKTQDDVFISPKIRFDDFNKMKTHSAHHGADHQWLKPVYFSNYEKYEE